VTELATLPLERGRCLEGDEGHPLENRSHDSGVIDDDGTHGFSPQFLAALAGSSLAGLWCSFSAGSLPSLRPTAFPFRCRDPGGFDC
jgi:hypothetical protein